MWTELYNATQLKNFLDLKLPPFFLHRVGDGESGNFKIMKVFHWIACCIALVLESLRPNASIHEVKNENGFLLNVKNKMNVKIMTFLSSLMIKAWNELNFCLAALDLMWVMTK